MHIAQMRPHRGLRGACIAIENRLAYPAVIRIHRQRNLLVGVKASRCVNTGL